MWDSASLGQATNFTDKLEHPSYFSAKKKKTQKSMETPLRNPHPTILYFYIIHEEKKLPKKKNP